MMRYCPWPSVKTVRVFSMSAGLDASTETPGSTAPLESRTTPAISAFCAKSREGTSVSANDITTRINVDRALIDSPPHSGDNELRLRAFEYRRDSTAASGSGQGL